MPTASKVLQSLGSPHGGGRTPPGRGVAGATIVCFLAATAIQVVGLPKERRLVRRAHHAA